MKRIILSSLLIALGGCTYRDASPGALLPFSVDPLALEGTITEAALSPEDPLLLRQTVPIRICLKDSLSLIPITAPRFLIVGTGREVAPDHRGCFVHLAQVDYRLTAPEAYISQTITLQSAETLEPTFTLSFWINPWDRQISDPRYTGQPIGAVEANQTENALKGEGLFSPARWYPDAGKTFFSNLAVRAFDLEPSLPRSTQNSTEVAVSLRLKIDLRSHRIDGTYRAAALARQSLTARLALIDRKTRVRLGGWASPLSLKVEAGEALISDSTVVVDRLPDPGAELAWYMRLDPQTAQSGILPWEGEVAVAPGTIAKAPKGPALEKSPVGWEALVAAPPAVEGSSRPHGFFLDRWSVKYARNLEVSPHTYGAKAGANAEVCLTDSITGEPLALQRFRVELSEKADISKEAVLAVADTAGCLRPGTPFPIHYSYFSPERYLSRHLVVKAESGPQAGVVRSVEVGINPWQKDDDLFFWDMRRGPAPANLSPRTAGIELSEFSYQYPPQKDDLDLDAQMKLTYKDVFYVVMKPTVNRPFSFSKERGPTRASEGLWPGFKFRVRLAVTGTRLPTLPNTDRYSHLRLLSAYETVATVDDRGMLVVPVAVAYDFSERPLLETVGRVYLEVSPDGQNGPDAVTLEAPFDPVSDGAHGFAAIPIRDRFDDIMNQLVPREMTQKELKLSEAKLSALSLKPDAFRLWKPALAKTDRPLDLFLNRVELPSNLTRINVMPGTTWPSELAQGAFTQQDFERLVGSDNTQFGASAQATLVKLCGLYFIQRTTPTPRRGSPAVAKSLYEQCRERPEYFLRLHRFRFVDNVVGEPVRLPTNTSTLQMNASFFQEQMDVDAVRKGHTGSHNIDAGVTAKVGYETFGNGVTAHVSYLYKNSWFKTRERSLSTGTRNQIQIQELRTLVAEETRVEADADVQDCVFFRHRPWMTRAELTETGRGERAYFFCQPSRRRIAESWFYVSDSVPNTSLPRRDARDLRNRIWLVLLRGNQSFSQFKALIENRASQIDIGQVPAFANGIDHLLNDVYRAVDHPFGLMGDGGVFPGVLSHAGRE